MTVKTRLVLLGICAILFLVVTPYIVLYSLGYRVNFTTWQIKGTGGIYVYAVPEPESILIDDKPAKSTGLFSTAVFAQNLMPGEHRVFVKKDGYHDYHKSLNVKEREVTKLENVVLFKQELDFATLASAVDYISVSPNENKLLTAKVTAKTVDMEILNLENSQSQIASLSVTNGKMTEDAVWSSDANRDILKISNAYYLLNLGTAQPTITPLPLLAGANQITFNPQSPQEIFFVKNKDLYSTLKILPVIKNVVAYTVNNQTITYLAYNGFLYESNLLGQAPTKISSLAFLPKTGRLYELDIIQGITFLRENSTLLWLDETAKTFEVFHANIKDFKASPNNQAIAYFNDNELLISTTKESHRNKMALDVYSEAITDCYWLNDSYLIVVTGNAIIITEIDNRGNINKITLPTTLPLLQGEPVALKTPVIFARQQDKKLYIFSQKQLIVSEKLIP